MNFVGVKMTWRGRSVSFGIGTKSRSTPIQLHRFPEMVQDHHSKLRGIDDGDPAGPAEEPVSELVEAIDEEAQGDAAIVVAFDFLGSVPVGLRDQFGGFPAEPDHDLVGLGTAIHAPGIAEIGLEVEILWDLRLGVGRPKRPEPSDPIGSRLVGMIRASDQIPGLAEQAESIWVEVQSLRPGLVGADVGSGQLSTLAQGPLDCPNGLVAPAVVGQFQVEDGRDLLDVLQEFGSLLPGVCL